MKCRGQTPQRHEAQLPILCCQDLPSSERLIYWPDFPTFTNHLPCDALNVGDKLSYRVHVWYGKTRTAGLQSGEGRMMID